VKPSFSQRWNEFWFREAAPHPLAILRIGFGLFLLFYFSLQFRYVAILYGDQGLHMPLYGTASWPWVLFAPPPSWAAHIIYWTLLGSLFLFSIGFFTRAFGTVAFLIYSYYWVLTLFQFGTSFDRLFIFTLGVLTCSGSYKAFSFDMLFRHGSFWAWEKTSVLAQRILSVQVFMTYVGVGWQKMYLPDWQSGEILIRGFIGRWATAPAWWIAQREVPLWIYDKLTWSVKACEIGMPFLFWHRRWRWMAFAFGAFFHISIAILMAIWWFVALIPAYIVFFTPEEIFRLCRRCFPLPEPPATVTP
jgi:hypothetical protein